MRIVLTTTGPATNHTLMFCRGHGDMLRKRLLVTLAGIFAGALLSSCGDTRLQAVPESPSPVTSEAFAATMAAVGRSPWREGNDISTHLNGDGFFPVMLQAIGRAEKSITFESFVNKRSTPVRQFSHAFADRARAGVKVHLVLDAYGSRHFGEPSLRLMREAGVEIELYSPFRLLRPVRYNHRTHRRILIVDGEVGFTGGAGWTERWTGNARSPEDWRDTQYELRGPVVRDLQHCFNDNWQELTGRALTGADYFPPIPRAGGLTAQHVTGSPLKSGDTIGSTYLLAINAARESILIEHSYFIPPKPISEALLRAARRGVAIEIIVPGEHTDMPIDRNAASRGHRDLLEAGVRMHEFLPTMMHGKLLVVDGAFAAVGSANLDGRSFFINDENNLHVLGAEFAREQTRMFERDRARCRRLGPDDIPHRVRDLPMNIFARALAGQL